MTEVLAMLSRLDPGDPISWLLMFLLWREVHSLRSDTKAERKKDRERLAEHSGELEAHTVALARIDERHERST